jgi:nitroreductase
MDMNTGMLDDGVLFTTRAVRRRLDLDRAVPRDVLLDCVAAAVQAPSGMDRQGWCFLFVSDPERKRAIAELYRRGYQAYQESGGPQFPPGDPRSCRRDVMLASQDHLALRLQDVPTLLVPLIEGRLPESPTTHLTASFYGSILPAVWSFMLAARARGIGTAWTTTHLRHEREVASVLGVPYERYTQVALIPVAYADQRAFKPGPRLPLDSFVRWERWAS